LNQPTYYRDEDYEDDKRMFESFDDDDIVKDDVLYPTGSSHYDQLPNSMTQHALRVIKRANSERISTLNTIQKKIFDRVYYHFYESLNDSDSHNPPLYMDIQGAGGSGKSYLIETLTHVIPNILLCAPSGSAAVLIGGETIHSAFKIKVRHSEWEPPSSGDYQERFSSINYVIIDEKSMMSSLIFAQIDAACRHFKGKVHEPFGGISVLLFGDFGQLPPVGGKSLISSGQFQDHGHLLFEQLFHIKFKLISNMRSSDAEFGEVLENLRLGKNLQSVYRYLHQHVKPNYQFLSPTSSSTIHDSSLASSSTSSTSSSTQATNPPVFLFSRGHEVEQKNDEALINFQPLICLRSPDTFTKFVGSPLLHTLELGKGCQVMLRVNLNLSLGFLQSMMNNQIFFSLRFGKWYRWYLLGGSN